MGTCLVLTHPRRGGGGSRCSLLQALSSVRQTVRRTVRQTEMSLVERVRDVKYVERERPSNDRTCTSHVFGGLAVHRPVMMFARGFDDAGNSNAKHQESRQPFSGVNLIYATTCRQAYLLTGLRQV